MKHKKIKVLVVDRHATMQLLVRHQLEKNGYEVVLTDTKEEAISIVLSGEVLCVIGSYNFEEQGCLALGRTLCSEPYNLDIPFVYYSTLDKELVELPHNINDCYLQMPFSMDQFNTIVQKLEAKVLSQNLSHY